MAAATEQASANMVTVASAGPEPELPVVATRRQIQVGQPKQVAGFEAQERDLAAAGVEFQARMSASVATRTQLWTGVSRVMITVVGIFFVLWLAVVVALAAYQRELLNPTYAVTAKDAWYMSGITRVVIHAADGERLRG